MDPVSIVVIVFGVVAIIAVIGLFIRYYYQVKTDIHEFGKRHGSNRTWLQTPVF